ncbi:hypothetical protein GJ496_003642 [Pomphorhynchus laevis]|nr:hypothetical protein GJ496_003642 [Pomphorhynchus laevis]
MAINTGEPLNGSIPLNSSLGFKILETSINCQRVQKYYTKQLHPTFCGFCTLSIVLNTLFADKYNWERSISEKDVLFYPEMLDLTCNKRVHKTGITLDELKNVSERIFGLHVNVSFAGIDFSNAVEMRELMLSHLKKCNAIIACNVDTSFLFKQRKTGHISPIGEYSYTEDMFLFMDVTPGYDPIWVSSSTLFNAMNTLDSHSKKKRGFLAFYAE